MKFRTHILLALAATAAVPFLAWSALQWSDFQDRMEEADREQYRATADAAALIAERLSSVRRAAEVADRTLAETEETPDLERLLRHLTEPDPFLKNLHVDSVSEEGVRVLAFWPPRTQEGLPRANENHGGRWHASLRKADGVLRWSPVLLSSETSPEPLMTFGLRSAVRPDRILSGAVSRAELFEDIRRHLEHLGYGFSLSDERGRAVWPNDPKGVVLWSEHPTKDSASSAASDKDSKVFATRATLSAGLPAWTVTVTRPQYERLSLATTLRMRLLFLALGVALLTLAAGTLAAKPLRGALAKLRADLDEEEFDRDDNRISGGPKELREVQEAYRALRRRLDLRNVALREERDLLESTVGRQSDEIAVRDRLIRRVFEESREAMLVLSAHGEVLHRNGASVGLLKGVSEPDLIARAVRECGEDAAAFVFTTEGKRGRSLECLAFRMPAPIPVGRVTPAGSETQEAVCVLVRDVTEREELERLKEDLIGIVAHELKTPVTACRLEIDRMRTKGADEEALAALDDSLVHLSRLIADWLTVAKIDGGTLRVSPAVVQTGPLIRRAVRLVRARYAFDFEMRIAESAECLWADPDAFVELLVNLLTNACRYALPGTVPEVSVEARSTETDFVLTVTDRGIGFPAEESERIFDRFHRVKNGRVTKAGGTGLGLVICRGICAAHGGTIRAASGEGRTVFTVRLPIATPSSTDSGLLNDNAVQRIADNGFAKTKDTQA